MLIEDIDFKGGNIMGKTWDAETDYKSDKKWERKYQEMLDRVKKPTFKSLSVLEKKDTDKKTSYSYYVEYVNDAIRELKAGRSYFIYNSDMIWELVKTFGIYLKCKKFSDYYEVSLKDAYYQDKKKGLIKC